MLIYFFKDQENLYRSSNYSITIDVAARKLSLFKDGKLFKTYPVAVGKISSPTPKGNFKIINKAENPGGPFGAKWLGLNAPNGDYGIHGTNNPSSIGKAVSNGCIRTYNPNIIEIYNLVPVGTSVKII
ncbi:L,D-transpeptidase [Clostridium sp. SHJSY1]|uniref:L,D-transpeptidase n=1 Tax=Clostridium sp. SHJSY1 TaxID=2942483 RepID=UPI0028748666|nr:L,D-transpeptidase [Clostridium sp. SHJSY1]MDS0526008.1 L,D-transpeptidase [Clostridium sp. SHJSY1]